MAELTVELDTSHSHRHFFLRVFLPRRMTALTCTISSTKQVLGLPAQGTWPWCLGQCSIVFMVF